MSVLIVGSLNTDILVRVRRAPVPGETVLGGDAQVAPGGKGANQAVAAARAGAPVAFCGAVGRASFAPVPREGPGGGSVIRTHPRELDVPSGVALITISDDGENSITVASGANARFRPEHRPADFSGVKHLPMQQEPSAERAGRCPAGQSSGGTGPAQRGAGPRPRCRLWPLLNLPIVNEHALAQLAAGSEQRRSGGPGTADPGVGTVIVTLGGRGSLAVTPNQPLKPPAPPSRSWTPPEWATPSAAAAAWLSGGAALPEALEAAT